MGCVENFGNFAGRDVRYFGVVDVERNLPGTHVGLHAVAFAVADELLAERLYFGNLVAFHDDGELVVAGSCQESSLFPALALEERCEVRDDSVGHLVAELADYRPVVVYFHHEDEQALARILVLSDELEVFNQAEPVVDPGKRVRCNPVFQQRHIDVQERKRKNRVRKRNIRYKVLNDASETRDKGDERKVERLFAVRGVPLADGVLNADNHRCDDVDKVDADKERQEPLELHRRRMAVVCKTVNADSDADKCTDDAWCREQREQVLVRIDALADVEEYERKPKLGKEQRRNEAQRVHDGVDDANFLVAPVKVALDVYDVQHLGHRA